MKKIIILISFITVYSHAFCQKDTSFFSFIDKFNLIELPMEYPEYTNYNELIDSAYLTNFVCDYENSCIDTYMRGVPRYFYGVKFHISSNFYMIIYHIRNGENKHTQSILTTYSKVDFKKISKLQIGGQKPSHYVMTGMLKNDLTIETKTIFSKETFPIKPDFEHPDYFWIEEIIDRFKITETGEIVFVKRISSNEYVARYGDENNYYDYPIKAPKKE